MPGMKNRRAIQKLLRENLGEVAGDHVLGTIEEMLHKGAKTATIEKAINTELQAFLEQQVVSAVAADLGPTPGQLEGIHAKVKPVIARMSISPRLTRMISVEPHPSAGGGKKR